MTIQEAITELEQIKHADEYVNSRLKCIIEDLTIHMSSIGEGYNINDAIAKQIENKSSAHAIVNHSWVKDLYRSILNMFRYEQCKEYYSREKDKREIKKVIDGETSSKWIEIVSAIWTILVSLGALIWFFVDKTGFSANDDGTFDFDKWGFIILLGSAVLVIIISIIFATVNARRKKRYSKNDDFPYSIDELLAVEYEKKPKRLGFLFPAAAKISTCQIAIGDKNKQTIIHKQVSDGDIINNF